MLRGSIRYKHQGNEYLMNVTALAMVEGVRFMLTALDFPTIDMWDEISNSSGVQVRNIQVNQTKAMSEIPNKVFVQTLSGTVRYCIANCHTVNRVITDDSMLESNRFNPEAISKYNIPSLGVVELKLGMLHSMKVKTPNIEIDLNYVIEEDVAIFRPFTGKQIGGKITSEILGFEPVQQVSINHMVTDGLLTLEEIISRNPDKNYSWLFDRDYRIVTDETLEEVFQHFMNTDSPIAFDTETTGLKITFKSRTGQADLLVGIILSDKVGQSFYFPIKNKAIKNLCDGDDAYFMERYMRPILETKNIVVHNGAFDWKVAYIYDINTNIVFDTMLAFEATLGYRYKGYKVGLKALTKQLLGRDSLELDDFVPGGWGSNGIAFWDLPAECVRLYACADTDNTLSLYEYVINSNLLGSYGANKIFEMEIIFSKAVSYQEFYGHMVDVEQIPKLQSDIEKIMARTSNEIFKLVGYEFNLESSIQLRKALYDDLGYPVQYKMDKGEQKVTTDKDAVAALCEYEDDDGRPLYPVAHILQEYRAASTINKNFLKRLHERATEDGFLFTKVKQMGTTTGRISVNEPNYQSYNDAVKKRIVPRPGFYMTDNDYSSIEYRVLAFMSGQPELIKAFEDPDLNYHTYQAARMFSVPYESVTGALRKQAKGINFGLPYGMGDASLGARVFGERNAVNTKKAAKLREKYFEGQEKILYFFENVRDAGVDNGYTSTYYGRRRYYDKKLFNEASIRRQAGNQVIQGTAADIYKLGVCRLFIEICKRGWLGKVLMDAFVHDEILCEVHKSIDPALFLSVVKKAFELKLPGCCPLYIGFGYGTSWYSAKKTEIPVQVQEKIIKDYAESGIPYEYWEQDGNKLYDWGVQEVEKFTHSEIKTALTSPEGQGKVLKPVITTYLEEVTKPLSKKYLKVKADFIKPYVSDIVDVKELKEYLKKKHIILADLEPKQILDYKAVFVSEKYSIGEILEVLEGYVTREDFDRVIAENNLVDIDDCRLAKGLQEEITIYCRFFGIDRSKVNIANTAKIDTVEREKSSMEVKTDNENSDIVFDRVKTFGMFLDQHKLCVVLNMNMPVEFMSNIRNLLNRNNQGYSVKLLDCNNNLLYDTPSFLSADRIQTVQQLYLIAMN